MTAFLFGPLQKAFYGPPEDKLPPLPKKEDPPPMAAQPKAPGNLPGEEDKTQAATVKDEKRRILSVMPKKTENKFAGETPGIGADAVIKKRVLGGGAGRATVGE